jgi:hypothetical protein
MRRTASPVQTEGVLPYLSDTDRLNAYNLLIDGCHHVWSKNKLQEDRLNTILDTVIPLTQKDPIFLARLLSYVMTHSESKDLQTVLTFVNALSSGDGTPFSPGSQYRKPNLRYVSAAALQMLDPKLAKRVAELSIMRFAVKDYFNEAQHFPSFLRTAFAKYLKYRESNLDIVRGIKKAGLGNTYAALYRMLHVSPSDEVAAILRWQQKGKKITFEKTQFDFEGKTDLEIAKTIRKKKLPVLGVLGALKRVSPVIAVALLEQCTGNQAVILHKTFSDLGLLDDPEVKKLYEEKIATAKTALDRVDVLTKESDKEIQEMMKKVRADVRKEQVGDIGKIFLHIDVSGSMEASLEVAKEKGAIIAEVVKNPQENFHWGLYNTGGEVLPTPQEFVSDAFKAILFGRTANGGTDALALYPTARQIGATIDIQVSDGGHNHGDIATRINSFHAQYPQFSKPKAMVLIHVRGQEYSDVLKNGYEEAGIPVAVMKPEALTESALVSQSIKEALIGPLVTIETIMETPLLELPRWWYSV